jgi:hypothetical protein
LKRVIFLALLGLAASPCSAQVFVPWNGTGAAPAPFVACPYTGTAAVDGCSGASTAGLAGASVQHANFFTGYTGQNYGRRPSNNVAGVEYPVGVDSATTLVDPTTSPPAGCSYDAANTRVLCLGVQAYTIQGYDFGLHGCTKLVFNPNPTAITIRNNKWTNGAGCEGNGNELVIFNGFVGNALIEKNYFDGASNLSTAVGGSLSMGSQTMLTTPGSPGSITLQYNAFVNFAGRVFQGDSTGDMLFKYNYVEGMTGYVAHSEVSIVSPTAGGTMANNIYAYNVIHQPASVLYPNGTAFLQTSVSSNIGTITNYTVNNNVETARLQNLSTQVHLADTSAGASGTPWAGSAGNTITFTPLPSGTPTVVTFVSGTPVGNQVQIGATGEATTANLLAFLQGSSDPNITHFTYKMQSWDGTGAFLTILFTGDATTMAMSVTSGGLGTSRASMGRVNYTSAQNFGAITYSNNWIDPSGVLICFSHDASPTPTYTSNINLTDGSAVDDSTCNGKTT